MKDSKQTSSSKEKKSLKLFLTYSNKEKNKNKKSCDFPLKNNFLNFSRFKVDSFQKESVNYKNNPKSKEKGKFKIR